MEQVMTAVYSAKWNGANTRQHLKGVNDGHRVPSGTRWQDMRFTTAS